MRVRKRLVLSAAGTAIATMTPLTLTVVTGATVSVAAPSVIQASGHQTLHKLGTTHFDASRPATGEVRPAEGAEGPATERAVVNRSPRSHAKATRGTPPPSGVTGTSLGVNSAESGWQGLNHRDQRLADGGNQWTTTPPDQGLCASSDRVIEMVNVAMQIYDTSGNKVGGVQALNPFFHFSHELLRNPDGTVVASPNQLGDPSCVFDQASGRFFVTVLDLTSDTDGNPTGPSFLDIAVSNSSDPAGTWTIYQLDTTDDGLHGTPDHPDCPCFPDYPHIGTDANGFYITSNEFPVFDEEGYDGANIYAMSKSALTSGAPSPDVVRYNTARQDGGLDGYTIAPALAADGNYATADNGTMYFLSSSAATQPTGTSSTNIVLWSLSNTTVLNSSGEPTLTNVRVPVPLYAIPPLANQKTGSVPLADCLNLTRCAKLTLGTPDRYKEYEYALDTGLDSGMLQSAYANGKVWGALDTAVDVGGVTKAGVAYYIVDPTTHALITNGTGTLVVPDNNITYPALGVTSAGKAVMAVSLLGDDYFPSAAYITLDDTGAAPSVVTVVGAGQGPDDEYGGYRGFLYNRARWGDYGAASVVGTTVWIASEYIAQTCTLAQFMTNTDASPFGSCNKTRTSLANWSTHITSVTP